MRHPLLTLLAFSSVLIPGMALRAADHPTVWSGLVLATAESKPLPKEVAPFKTKLEHVFGYDNFVLIGQHREVMDEPTEHWLVPSKMLCLHAVSRQSKDPQRYNVELELFREKEMLVSTKVQLVRGSPLFIRGPQCSRGQLVIILMVE